MTVCKVQLAKSNFYHVFVNLGKPNQWSGEKTNDTHHDLPTAFCKLPLNSPFLCSNSPNPPLNISRESLYRTQTFPLVAYCRKHSGYRIHLWSRFSNSRSRNVYSIHTFPTHCAERPLDVERACGEAVVQWLNAYSESFY